MQIIKSTYCGHGKTGLGRSVRLYAWTMADGTHRAMHSTHIKNHYMPCGPLGYGHTTHEDAMAAARRWGRA